MDDQTKAALEALEKLSTNIRLLRFSCDPLPMEDRYGLATELQEIMQTIRAALSTDTAELVEVGYQYLFIDPMIGRDVWRNRSDEWNGQRPKASRKIYILKQEAGNNG